MKAKGGFKANDVAGSDTANTTNLGSGGGTVHVAISDFQVRGDPKPMASTSFPVNSIPKGEAEQATFPAVEDFVESEKEKMLAQQMYYPFSPDLLAERELCKAACWRFNNAATNPNLGISKVEQGRLLLEVLRPGRNWESAPNVAGGYMADGYSSDLVDVNIEAPFTCSYGYNIRIGKDVHIHSGCTIQDSNLVRVV